MVEASRIVLSGFELRTDVYRVLHPDRYQDPRGTRMWRQVTELLAKRTGGGPRAHSAMGPIAPFPSFSAPRATLPLSINVAPRSKGDYV